MYKISLLRRGDRHIFVALESKWTSLMKIMRDRILQVTRSLRSKVRFGFGAARAGKSIRHRWLYNLLIVSLMGYFGLSALFTLNKARSEPLPVLAAEPEKAKIKEPVPMKPLEEYMVIVTRNLFGGTQGDERPEPEEFSPEDVPLAQRSVGLRLVGTVVTDEPARNVAIIENQRARKQEAYHEGDRVEQIQIRRILRNNVIISMGTEEQRLSMDLDENAASTPAAGDAVGNSRSIHNPRAVYRRPKPRSRRPVRTMPQVPSRDSVQSEQPESEANPSEMQGDQPESETGAIRLEQQEIDSALADTDKVTAEMQIKPHKEGDESGGFQIGSVKPGSIFAKMGLRPGDVVTGLNEEAVTGAEQVEDLYNSLMKGGDIGLEVKRGGRTQKLQVEVE